MSENSNYEMTAERVDAWLTAMRKDPLIGKDIQELESWRPQALRRVMLVALESYTLQLTRGNRLEQQAGRHDG